LGSELRGEKGTRLAAWAGSSCWEVGHAGWSAFNTRLRNAALIPVAQCIPEGTTYDMIREDPEWTSPYCKEFLHPDAGWDVAYFEAVIVNLKLNLTVSYLGYDNMYETLLNRSRDNIPTIFYWWEPEGLLVKIDAGQVCSRRNPPPAAARVGGI